jgi:hypothetical protein
MPGIHIAGNVLFGLMCLAAGILLARRKKTGANIGLGLAAFIFLGHFVLNARPDLHLRFLPSPDLIFYTNLFPFAVLMAVPCFGALSKSRGQKARVAVLAAALIILSLFDYRYFLAPLAETRGTIIDQNGICLQTSNDTCSAAAAVTLLNLYGIDATEQQVVDVALTKKGRGTRHLGLVRALSLLTVEQSHGFVRIEKMTVNELVAFNHPAIIRVGVPKHPVLTVHRELVKKYNWTPGFVHDVVFLGVDPNDANYVWIGEPQFGLERWPIRHLRALYDGFAVYLDKPIDVIVV